MKRPLADITAAWSSGHDVDESIKNDIAIAERLKITVTTLDGILDVKGQGRIKPSDNPKGGSNAKNTQNSGTHYGR